MIPNNMYMIKVEDIQSDMIIYADDTDNGLGLTQYRVKNKVHKNNNLIVLECINMNLNIDQELQVNTLNQRAMYTSKLQSGWRKI